MWELDCEESWVPKKWCFWTVMLEKTLENLLDSMEIQPVHPKGNQSWIFTGRADAPILWPPDAKNWLICKNPDAGKDWRRKEKGMTEDKMVGWHHQLDGRDFEWTPGDGDGQGGLACCNSWGRKQSDTTEQLNWTELNWTLCKANQQHIPELSYKNNLPAWQWVQRQQEEENLEKPQQVCGKKRLKGLQVAALKEKWHATLYRLSYQGIPWMP